MKNLLILTLAMLLAACGTVRKVESGANLVGERMSINVDGNWNHLDFPGIKPAQVWTMEGITIPRPAKSARTSYSARPCRLRKSSRCWKAS